MSNASPASATRPTRARRPVCTRCWRTAPMASSMRDRRAGLVGGAIADDEDAGARGAPRAPPPGERGERRAEAVDAVRRVPDRIESHGREARDVPQRCHLLGQQHRMLQAQHARVRGPLQQRRAAPAQMHAERHHHRLAQRIDRRVRHLREALPEIGVDALRLTPRAAGSACRRPCSTPGPRRSLPIGSSTRRRSSKP